MTSIPIYNQYLEKHASHTSLIDAIPDPELEAIVIIPCFYEHKILDTLNSLLEAVHIGMHLEVIVLLNHSENAEQQIIEFHRHQYLELTEWMSRNSNSNLRFHCSKPVTFKSKIAGVGAARKAGMDEAIRRFNQIGQSHGIIINTDADCLLHKDYWNTIIEYFHQINSKACVNLNFQHRYDENPELTEAIILYELHLLYYIQAQKWIQYPFAYQTIGSSFAVKSIDYCKQGGMNQRQAGEDFYFLHKFSLIGQLDDIDKILVYPSSRKSMRVPFGTGKAISKYEEYGTQFTYNLNAIELFGNFIKLVPDCYNSDKVLEQMKNLNKDAYDYFIHEGMLAEIDLCRKNCSNTNTFTNRLMKWFNPFRLMKYLHYMREYNFSDQEIKVEAQKLLKKLEHTNFSDSNSMAILQSYRKIK